MLYNQLYQLMKINLADSLSHIQTSTKTYSIFPAARHLSTQHPLKIELKKQYGNNAYNRKTNFNVDNHNKIKKYHCSNLAQLNLNQQNLTEVRIPPSLEGVGELSREEKLEIEAQINKMFENIQKIINYSQIQEKDAMNYMRAAVLFRDIEQIGVQIVDELMSEYAKSKIESLQSAIHCKNQLIQSLQQELKQSTQYLQPKSKNINSIFKTNQIVRISNPNTEIKSNSINQIVSNSMIFDQISSQSQLLFKKGSINSINQHSAAQTLYYKARAMEKQDWIQQLNKAIFCGKIEIIKVKDVFKRRHKNSNFSQSRINQNQNHERTNFLCNNPCCRILQEPISVSQKLQSRHKSRPRRLQTEYYHSDKTDEYFNRYYKNRFKVEEVRSVERTKAQEMQGLQAQYKRRKLRESKCKSKKKERGNSLM